MADNPKYGKSANLSYACTTYNHPFWVEETASWVPAGRLVSGWHLQSPSRGGVLVGTVEQTGLRESVFNLQVASSHSYLVGESGVLVHNCKGGKKASQATGAGRAAKVAKAESTVWQGLKGAGRTKKGRISTGSGKKTRHFEWDNTHGDIEVYDSNGKHLGSMHPENGEMYKEAVKGRTIDL